MNTWLYATMIALVAVLVIIVSPFVIAHHSVVEQPVRDIPAPLAILTRDKDNEYEVCSIKYVIVLGRLACAITKGE